MPRRAHVVAGVLLACAVLACGGPTELEPRVSALAIGGTYFPGSLVVIRVRNPTDGAVVIDRCAGELQGWTLGDFGGPPAMTVARVCSVPVPALRVEAGGTAEDTLQLGPAFVPGQWRVRLDLRDEQGRLVAEDERTTNVFEVREPPGG